LRLKKSPQSRREGRGEKRCNASYRRCRWAFFFTKTTCIVFERGGFRPAKWKREEEEKRGPNRFGRGGGEKYFVEDLGREKGKGGILTSGPKEKKKKVI